MGSSRGSRGFLLSLLALAAGVCPGVFSQAPDPSVHSSPVTALPTMAPAQPESKPSLEERLRLLEETNKGLAEQLQRTRNDHDAQMQQLLERYGELSQRSADREAEAQARDDAAGRMGSRATGTGGSPVPDYTEGQLAPFSAAPGYPDSNVLNPNRFPLLASFGPGFQLQSEDERFRLQIHYESQIEGRVWEPDQLPTNNGFFLPRQRFFFTGNITKPIEYELAINRGLNNINLLNAFVNIHFDDRFELRMGRFFTPFPYEQYAVSNYWLLTPERSVFTTNLGPNRQIGAMAWGYLLDERLDYAAGFFNGSRNSFESLNNALDFVGYVNARPFQQSESLSFARCLNLGTSLAVGRQDQNPAPVTFRIGGGSPDTNIPGPATVPFLILNPDVVERGERVLGSVHAAYFYKGLSLMGEWQYGFGGYASSTQPSTRVPFSGFYFAGGYFLTGEEVERRTRVKPLRSLIPVGKDDQRGIGAWEAAGRVGQLRVGEEMFNAGFADRNIWSNSVVTTELGVNWYWNEYIKWYAFWLHGDFGSPVQFRPGESTKTADMFWLRCQLYF